MLLGQVSTIKGIGFVLYKVLPRWQIIIHLRRLYLVQSSLEGSIVNLVRNGKGFFNLKSRG